MAFIKNVKVTIPDKLLFKAFESASRQIVNRIDRTEGELLDKIRELLRTAIMRHPVYRGLLGKFAGWTNGNDLQAEFGLTDDMAQVALDTMMKILLETVKIDFATEKTPRTWKIYVQVSFLDPKDYADDLRYGSAFSYINKGGSKEFNNVRITWMKWLIDNVETILGDYGITYVGVSHSTYEGLSTLEESRSRSGRALMTSEENFPYLLPKIAIPAGSAKNFVEEIAYNKELRQLVNEEIKKIEQRELLKQK